MVATTGPIEQPNHTSPEVSSFHLSLRSAARKAGHEDNLRDILWLLDASDLLYDIRRIAANLLRLLPTLGEIAALSSQEDEIKAPLFVSWEPVLEWIRGRLPVGICPETGGPDNPYGGNSLKRNPLWVDLWENVEFDGYRTLQAQFVFAHVRYLYTCSLRDTGLGRLSYERYGGIGLWNALPDSTYEAGLRIRQLTDPPWNLALDELPELRPALAYQEALPVEFPANDPESSAKWQKDFRETIRLFLARANGFEQWPLRESSGRSQRSHRPALTTLATENVTPGDPDDEFTRGWPEGSVVTIAPELPDELVQEVIAYGGDPAEFADPTEYYVALPARPADSQPPALSTDVRPPALSTDIQRIAIRRAIAVRGQYRHVQMQHQLLPFEYNIPAAQEIRSLLSRLDEGWHKLCNEREWDLNTRRTAEVIALIQIQVWFGVSQKRAQSLVAVSASDGQREPTQGLAEGTLAYDRWNAEWILPVDTPSYKSVVPDLAEHAHSQLKWLPLQDVGNIGRFVEAILGHAGELNRRTGRTATDPHVLFSADENYYEQAVREFLKADDSTRRITLRRLGGFVLNRLVALSGDLMAGALITGRLGTLTRTERSYASYSVKNLRKLYYRAASRMHRQVAVGSVAMERPVQHPELWKGHVGARLCAHDANVKDAIRNMQDRIDSVRDVKGQRVDFHNLMTLYSVLMFCFCTSCRPIRTPFLGRQRIDEETGFAYLADKDDDAHHKLRLVWVPDLCRKQMRSYEMHCGRLALHHEGIRDWPDPCFFLTDKRDPICVRPVTIADHLRPFLQLPQNFYRAYLRHRLLEAGTPPEVVMAWLGHAFAGEEIWNVHSAMSAIEYRDCIESFLMPILEKDLKWKMM